MDQEKFLEEEIAFFKKRIAQVRTDLSQTIDLNSKLMSQLSSNDSLVKEYYEIISGNSANEKKFIDQMEAIAKCDIRGDVMLSRHDRGMRSVLKDAEKLEKLDKEVIEMKRKGFEARIKLEEETREVKNRGLWLGVVEVENGCFEESVFKGGVSEIKVGSTGRKESVGSLKSEKGGIESVDDQKNGKMAKNKSVGIRKSTAKLQPMKNPLIE